MPKPVRDPQHLKFVRSLPCCVGPKNCRGRIEAAHTGPHGMKQKSSDLSCIPLCVGHHQSRNDSLHKLGPIKFQEIHGIDIASVIARIVAKPRVTIVNGWFIAEFQDDAFVLCAVAEGLEHAMKKLRRIRYREAA